MLGKIKEFKEWFWLAGLIAIAAATYTGMTRDIQAAEVQYKAVDRKLEKFVADQKEFQIEVRRKQERYGTDIGDIKGSLRLLLERTAPKK